MRESILIVKKNRIFLKCDKYAGKQKNQIIQLQSKVCHRKHEWIPAYAGMTKFYSPAEVFGFVREITSVIVRLVSLNEK